MHISENLCKLVDLSCVSKRDTFSLQQIQANANSYKCILDVASVRGSVASSAVCAH